MENLLLDAAINNTGNTSLILSRIQFAFTLSFHIIFPTLTIGLACFIATMEGMWLKTGQTRYRQQVEFWLKPFALTFGMGVVTGVVLSYEFGTNFSRFSEITGPVIGPLMAYEVMTAFFLEAGFLGIMLFGRNKVSPKVYFFATATVALGTLISSFWIIAANSWMQTPQGAELIDGQYVVISWYEVIFNPSFPYRLTHMLMASFVTTGFVIAGVNGALIIKRGFKAHYLMPLKIALFALAVLTPLQVVIGDLHGLNVKEHQPIKVAAMEGIWQDEKGAGFRVLAWPSNAQERNLWELKVPYLASLILTHQLDGHVQGLKSVAADERPNVMMVFYSFRVMLLIGILMLLTAFYGCYRLLKNKPLPMVFLRWLKWMIPSGFIATLAGWYVAEIGRQPWVVYGQLKTQNVHSLISSEQVMLSLCLFVIGYGLLFSAYCYFMNKTLKRELKEGECYV